MPSVYDFEVQTITGQTNKLDIYKDKVLLIVNTASKCGLTPQFEGLEKLYQDYHDKGLEILGFPCNQFGHQDPGSENEIQQFCQMNYGVNFPMHSKIDVNGNSTHPLYKHLKNEALGLLGSKKIKWNFTKFLISKQGCVLERFAPTTKPEAIKQSIETALKAS